jgi:hypothetical protein
MDRSVTVSVGGEDYQLQVTLDALLKVHKRFGSIGEAARRLQLMDFVAACDVIAIGAGLRDEKLNSLRKAVFKAGLITVTPAISDYVALMLDPEGRDAGESSGEA